MFKELVCMEVGQANSTHCIVITVINTPMGDEHKWIHKEGVGVFSRVVIFLLKVHQPHSHAVRPALLMYCAVIPNASFFMSLACAITANDVPSFVSVPSCLVLLA